LLVESDPAKNNVVVTQMKNKLLTTYSPLIALDIAFPDSPNPSMMCPTQPIKLMSV
jgi:hypothetical protein